MENLIDNHTNPMKSKKPFIKKSRQSNLSFLSKPNLSITKASHRFSLDKTFTCPSYRQDTSIKTPRDLRNQFTYPQILQDNEQSFSARLSLGKQNINQSKRRDFTKMQRKTEHKQKLRSILQSIEMNNQIIEEIFQHEDEIQFFKTEIKKTLNLHKVFHSEISKQVEKDRQKRRLSFNQCRIQQRVQQKNRQEMLNKVEQLRNKKKMWTKQKQEKEQQQDLKNPFSLNNTFC